MHCIFFPRRVRKDYEDPQDRERKEWLIVDVESRGAARRFLPAAHKSIAKIIKLTRFTRGEIDELLR
jgi:hypothetical protein